MLHYDPSRPVNYNDPARAKNRTYEQINTRGAIFNINEGIVVQDNDNCSTRLIGWPGIGTRMVSFHTLTHAPGGSYELHHHQISEESMICVRGKGEINLGRGWVKVEAGNAIFVPSGCKHATRNQEGSDEDFVILSYNCPPPLDLYQKYGFFKNGAFDFEEIAMARLYRSPRGNIPLECVMKLNDLGSFERGEDKGPAETALTGGVFHIFRGAPFYMGTQIRFILWPGIGTKNIGHHNGFIEPGKAFRPHIHPISEDAFLIHDGIAKGYLESRWIDMEIGDILYAPAGIRHGCGSRTEKTVVSSGCACPPQFDLYEKAGYLKDGFFTEFTFEDWKG